MFEKVKNFTLCALVAGLTLGGCKNWEPGKVVNNHFYPGAGSETTSVEVEDERSMWADVPLIANIGYTDLGTYLEGSAGSFTFAPLIDGDSEAPNYYEWTFGDNSFVGTSSGAPVLHKFEEPGWYIVNLAVYDENEEHPRVAFAETEIYVDSVTDQEGTLDLELDSFNGMELDGPTQVNVGKDTVSELTVRVENNSDRDNGYILEVMLNSFDDKFKDNPGMQLLYYNSMIQEIEDYEVVRNSFLLDMSGLEPGEYMLRAQISFEDGQNGPYDEIKTETEWLGIRITEDEVAEEAPVGESYGILADFKVSHDEVEVGEPLYLVPMIIDTNGTGLNDLEGEWDFGDGTFSTDENPVHVYTRPGDYIIGLRVFDSDGDSASIYRMIEVEGTPVEEVVEESIVED
jgi:PKD repeat protein